MSNHATTSADPDDTRRPARPKRRSPTDDARTLRSPYPAEVPDPGGMGDDQLTPVTTTLPDWMSSDEREPTAEIVLLTKIKTTPPPGPAPVEPPSRVEAIDRDLPPTEPRRSSAPPPLPIREGVEDGLVPAGELDRLLNDMSVLARYGHHDQVRDRLDVLMREFPEDILLVRRVVELFVELGDRQGTLDALFVLAGRLFERRNVKEMREALEQVLVIEPDNRRAYKLLGLLDERPSTGTGR